MVKIPGPDRVVPSGPSVVDLHTHTLRSDGLLEPRELVEAVYAAGVRLLAVTDHDTLAGVRELLRPDAQPLPPGLRLIPGVEINAVNPPRDVGTGGSDDEIHLIGLGVDPKDDAFEALLSDQRAQRRRRFDRMLGRLRELGMPVDGRVAEIDLTDESALGRPTLARALVGAGHATSVEDAFSRWLGAGAPAFVPRDGVGPVAAIAAIRGAGGLPVLAHFWAARERIATVRGLAGAGLGGIEVHHWSFDRATVASVGGVATELGLVASGGTDYHGDLGTYTEIHAGLWVPPSVGDAILSALRLPPA